MTLTKRKKRIRHFRRIRIANAAKNRILKRRFPDAFLRNKRKLKLKERRRRYIQGTKGVILVSRIPYGFFRKEMKLYFSQFGQVTRVMHARSCKTGRSCKWAFVEFAFREVAKVVAQTMDGFPMFGTVLKCKYLEPRKVTESMFRKSRMDITQDDYPGLRAFKRSIRELNRNRESWQMVKREVKLKKRYRKTVRTLQKLGINCNPLGIELSGAKVKDAKSGTEEKMMEDTEVEGEEMEEEEVTVTLDDELEEDSDEQELDEEEMHNARELLTAKIKKALSDSCKKKKKEEEEEEGVGEEEPMVLEVDESDDEIQFKTPPQAVKKFVKMSSASPKLKTRSVKSPGGSAIKKKRGAEEEINDDSDDGGNVVMNNVSPKVTPVKRSLIEKGVTPLGKKRKTAAVPAAEEVNGIVDDTPTAKATPKSAKKMGSVKKKVLGSEKKKVLLTNDVPALQKNAVKDTPVAKASPKSAKNMGSTKKRALKPDNETTQINGAAEDTLTATETPKSAKKTPGKSAKKTPKVKSGKPFNVEIIDGTLSTPVEDVPARAPAKTPKQTPGKPLKTTKTPKETPVHTPAKKAIKKTPKHTPDTSLQAVPEEVMSLSSKKTPKVKLRKSDVTTSQSNEENLKPTLNDTVNGVYEDTALKAKGKTPEKTPAKIVEGISEDTPLKAIKKTPKKTPAKPVVKSEGPTPSKFVKTPKQTPHTSAMETPELNMGTSSE